MLAAYAPLMRTLAARAPLPEILAAAGPASTGTLRPGPKAENKWCTASLIRPPEQVITDAFDQAQARDPAHQRPWVVLVDGARNQLDLMEAETARRDAPVHILLDFVHVAEYCWTDAHSCVEVACSKSGHSSPPTSTSTSATPRRLSTPTSSSPPLPGGVRRAYLSCGISTGLETLLT